MNDFISLNHISSNRHKRQNQDIPLSPTQKFSLFLAATLADREGDGNPLQYSCLEIPWTEEPGGLQSMGSQRVGHDWVASLSLFTFMQLEKEMATHSSVLAWRIPGTGEAGGLPSMGSHRVRHDWSNAAAGPSILLQMAIFHSFLWLSNIPLYICTNLLYPLLSWWTFRLLPCPAIVNSVCAASLLTFTAGSHPGDTPPMFLYWAPPSAFLSRSCFQNLNPFWAQ